ncbi:MAG: GTPase [Candidatus Woesearchaeota archaeon]
MPTNVTEEYNIAKRKYESASGPREKLAALELMYAEVPKHKGTEKLRSHIKKKISKTKDELEKQEKNQKSAYSLAVKKKGAAQVVILGTPNSGKSTFLKKMTNKDVEVANYPFTTKEPVVGMAFYEDAQIQLVEIPPVIEDFYSKSEGAQLMNIARNSDLLLLMCNGSENIVLKEINNSLIKVNKKEKKINYKKGAGELKVIGEEKVRDADYQEIIQVLRENNFTGGHVTIYEELSINDIVDIINPSVIYKPLIYIINDGLYPGYDIDKEPKISINDPKDKIVKMIWKKLDALRVYTKIKGEEASDEPIILKRESTIEDLAKKIHKDFLRKFRFARVWGSSKFPGQKVGKDYILKDKDTVEIHLK